MILYVNSEDTILDLPSPCVTSCHPIIARRGTSWKPGKVLQTGDNCSAHSYEPHEIPLGARSVLSFAPDGGRPTNGAHPFFNVAYDGGGLIAVIGWPGQWAAHFARDADAGLTISAGQQKTHFKLLPGEEVRSPLVVLQFWQGDRIHAQNTWRRWMVAHNIPRSC